METDPERYGKPVQCHKSDSARLPTFQALHMLNADFGPLSKCFLSQSLLSAELLEPMGKPDSHVVHIAPIVPPHHILDHHT